MHIKGIKFESNDVFGKLIHGFVYCARILTKVPSRGKMCVEVMLQEEEGITEGISFFKMPCRHILLYKITSNYTYKCPSPRALVSIKRHGQYFGRKLTPKNPKAIHVGPTLHQ